MLINIISKFGLPFLIKLVRSGLEKIGNTVAQKAGIALKDVSTAIEKQEISAEEISLANKHLEKMKELENDLDKHTLNTIHQTIRQELEAEDRFVRFWRPAFGYSVALAWFLTMATLCYVILAKYPNAESLINALVETTSLWSVALGVLGIQVVKSSREKTSQDKESLINKIIKDNQSK